MNALRRWVIVLLVPLSACAWARRENRPVWNAFESNLVPESQGTFVATLPLTVPVGLLAILTDTFVAHPLQVVDDAADDAADLWRGIELEPHYYTQAGTMPLRAIGTPFVFVGSFLGRSLFDIRTAEQEHLDANERIARQRRKVLEWLQQIAAGKDDVPHYAEPEELDPELRAAFAEAMAKATALGRMRLYEQAARHESLAAHVDWRQGLADPSAVVRYRVLQVLPRSFVVPDELQQRLLADPDEAVRVLAARPRKR